MTTIQIPEKALVLLVGPAGSGKSTFARKSFLPSQIVSSDFCREAISDDATDQKVSPLAFDLFHFWIEQRLKYGKLAVADATNVRAFARQKLREIAAKYETPIIVFRMTTDLATCLRFNESRSRRVPVDVIERHVAQAAEAKDLLAQEGYAAVYDISPDVEYEIVQGEPGVIEAPGFDCIGDVHGCYNEFTDLLIELGYDPFREWEHPEGRKLVLVGDLTDRGPHNFATLALVRSLVERGIAYCVLGNHDSKLMRALKGNPVKMGHGLAATFAELWGVGENEPGAMQEYQQFLASLPHQLHLRVPGLREEVIVTHAGIPRHLVGSKSKLAVNHALYGEVVSVSPDGAPTRSDQWRKTWPGDGDLIQVHGHTVTDDPWPRDFVNVVNVDTGCVFGGKLTALRVPEFEIMQVVAYRAYAEN